MNSKINKKGDKATYAIIRPFLVKRIALLQHVFCPYSLSFKLLINKLSFQPSHSTLTQQTLFSLLSLLQLPHTHHTHLLSSCSLVAEKCNLLTLSSTLLLLLLLKFPFLSKVRSKLTTTTTITTTHSTITTIFSNKSSPPIFLLHGTLSTQTITNPYYGTPIPTKMSLSLITMNNTTTLPLSFVTTRSLTKPPPLSCFSPPIPEVSSTCLLTLTPPKTTSLTPPP